MFDIPTHRNSGALCLNNTKHIRIYASNQSAYPKYPKQTRIYKLHAANLLANSRNITIGFANIQNIHATGFMKSRLRIYNQHCTRLSCTFKSNIKAPSINYCLGFPYHKDHMFLHHRGQHSTRNHNAFSIISSISMHYCGVFRRIRRDWI